MTSEIAEYKIEWVVNIIGEKEPRTLNEKQWEAVQQTVNDGKQIAFFKHFAIGVSSIRSADIVRTPIINKEMYVPIDENGDPVDY